VPVNRRPDNITGGDKFRIATVVGIGLSIAMLIILELLASLSGDAARLGRSTTSHPFKTLIDLERSQRRSR
jgi:hypothetical protein